MKFFKINIVFLLFLFVACSPVRYIGIETYNPSGISFPREVREILIVNNAVPQPEVPYETSLAAKKTDTVTIAADSALWDFCRTLGLGIAEATYFEDVRLLEKGYRKDHYFFSDRQLTTDDVALLCREHQVDAIISLDRLLFQLNETFQHTLEFNVEGWIDVEVSGVLRVYLPDRDTPLTSILIADTLFPQLRYDGNMLDFSAAFADADELVREAAQIVAERSLINFIPYWSEDARWYYVSSNAKWKEAAAYANSDKWSQAYTVWKQLYDDTKDSAWQSKARLASNMALSCELTGDFSKALYWATDACRLLQDQAAEDDRYVKLQKKYVDVLQYRILSDKRLHLQVGE